MQAAPRATDTDTPGPAALHREETSEPQQGRRSHTAETACSCTARLLRHTMRVSSKLTDRTVNNHEACLHAVKARRGWLQSTGHAGRRGAPSGQTGTHPLVGG
eukprot:3988500-Prymnesium_polylepis.2